MLLTACRRASPANATALAPFLGLPSNDLDEGCNNSERSCELEHLEPKDGYREVELTDAPHLSFEGRL